MPSPLKRANSVAFKSVFNRLSILACDFESQAGGGFYRLSFALIFAAKVSSNSRLAISGKAGYTRNTPSSA